MTFGFKFLNDLGDTVLDDSSVKPWFLKQAPATAIEDVTANYNLVLNKTDPETGESYTDFSPPETWYYSNIADRTIKSWTVYKVTYSTSYDYNTFVLFNLPVNNSKVYYSCPNPVSLHPTLGGNGTVEIFAFIPNTWSASTADIPKAYVFVADPIPNSEQTSGFGVKLFNSIEQCLFDSGKKHLQPTGFPSMLASGDFTSPRGYSPELISVNLNTLVRNVNNEYTVYNSAWLLPYCKWVYVSQTPSGPWYNNFYEVLYRRRPDYNSNLSNLNPMETAEVATYRTINPSASSPGMYFGPNGSNQQTTYLQSMVIDATPLDGGVVPPTLPPAYTLSKDKLGISEGESYTTNRLTITLSTTAVPNGTVVPFTITGIEAADILPITGFVSTLTGNFLVVDNTAAVEIQAASDSIIEGTQTATLALNNGRSSVSFTISDFISYSLSSFMTPEEGQSIAVTLNTQGIANNSLVPYTITGISQADLTVGTLTGNFTISNNTGALEFRFAKDTITDNETMRISVNNGATFLDIPITNVPYGNEILTISPSTFNYDQRTSITITGGTPYGSFEFTSVPQGEDPVYAWNNRWKPEYATVGTQYFDENGNFSNPPATALGPDGSDLGGNPNAVSNRTFWIFNTTTKNFRSFNYTINPTQTFSITGSDGTKGPLTISETSTGYFKVTTTNVPTGTVVYPKFINTDLSANDYTNSAASGVAVNSSGIANFTIEFTADQTTDGTKTGELVVQYPNGTTKDSYGVITVLDASLTPPGYSVSRYVANVNENGLQFFTISWTNVPIGTQLWWDLSGTNVTTNDIQYVYHNNPYNEDGWVVPSGGSTLNNTFTTGTVFGSFQVIIYPRSDAFTEGEETVTFNVRTGYSGGPSQANTSFIINDTSTTPAPTVYNEVVTIVSDNSGDYRVELNNYMTIQVTGGMPGGSFMFETTANGAAQPTSFTGGPSYLTVVDMDAGDPGGRFTNYITGATARGSQTVGDFRLWFKFNYNNNVRSARYQVVYDAGTNSGGTYCVGSTLYQNKNDGLGGTYQQVVQTNSPTCQIPVTQYYPTTSASTYYYYKATNTYDNFIVNGAKPGGTVRFTITSGIYEGIGYSRTATDPGGVATYDPGVGDYAAGTYTANITFPGQDADYPVGYRTLPITWIVVAASAPPPSLTVTGYSFTKTAGWENNIDVYGSPSAAYDGLRVRGTDSVTGEGVNSIDKQVIRSFTTNVACTISYRLTVSSEAAYDFGYFYIDGVEKIKRSGLDVAGGEAGTGPYLTMALAAGSHTIRVRYTKDGSQTTGGDNAFGEYSLAV